MKRIIELRPMMRFALLAAWIVGVACLWTAWCEFPMYAWNETRLAPAFALRYGINPYPPVDGGPLSTWIYGPVGIVVNLPATLATTAAAALQLAYLVNLSVVLLPLVVIFFGSSELRSRGPAGPWLALGFGLLLVPRPNLVLQVADHAAIASGLLSCWFLTRDRDPTPTRLAIAAASCALAIGAKQIEVFLLPAQLAYLLIGRERNVAGKYFAWVACFTLVGFAVAAWAFGLDNLRLNLVEIPGRLPWADIAERMAMRPAALVAQVALPSIGLAAIWRKGLWPARASESGRMFQITALAYVAMLPVGLAAFVKIGGDTNLLHSWDYLLPGCLLAWLPKVHTSRAGSVQLLTVTAAMIALHGADLISLPIRPYTRHFATAAQLTAAYPHAIWFPRNPLITFYADHQLWHSEDGVQTRFLAGYGLREPDFRRHLPPQLRAVAYPSVVEFHFSMALLSEFKESYRVPYWTVHTRAPPPPANPSGKPVAAGGPPWRAAWPAIRQMVAVWPAGFRANAK